MFDLITGYFNNLKTIMVANPIVAGAVSLYGLGVVTYLLRDIPRKIGGLTKNYFGHDKIVELFMEKL